MEKIKIGGRVDFEKFEELESRFRYIDFPFELALPWRYKKLWLPIEQKLEEIQKFFKSKDLNIIFLHATQGRISEESFLEWGKKTLDFADELNLKYVTIHPNQRKTRREEHRLKALKFIKKLEIESKAQFCIETFNSKRRIFRPEEIIENKLPMTLDTAHFYDNSRIINVVENYHCNIKVVHLSSKGEKEHHLPIDTFCVEVARTLLEKDWVGNIILEYLPWHHYRMRNDIESLRKHLFEGKKLNLKPVSDKYKDKPEKWHF